MKEELTEPNSPGKPAREQGWNVAIASLRTACTLGISKDYLIRSAAEGLVMRVLRAFLKDSMRRSGLAGELFSRKQRVHRARAESLEVQGHELETESFENASELCGHLGTESARQFVVG